MLWVMVCRLLKIKSTKEWIILCLIHLFSWEKEMYFLTNGQEGSCPFYPVKKLLSGSTVWIANVEGELGETECFKWAFFSLAYSIFKGFVFCFFLTDTRYCWLDACPRLPWSNLPGLTPQSFTHSVLPALNIAS